jgi:ABC-2 type transport system ATP-binding protein
LSSSAICGASAPAPLRVNALVKYFGQVTAVDGITLELRPGECLGLLGPNGAGKSTLIRSIVGRVIPDAGAITVFGARADSAAARNALGWIPQELALYPRLTCRENLQSFGRYHGLSGATLEQAVARCLGWATLTDRSGELVKNLSGSMKRRLNMAAGLIHQPTTHLIMPEPKKSGHVNKCVCRFYRLAYDWSLKHKKVFLATRRESLKCRFLDQKVASFLTQP